MSAAADCLTDDDTVIGASVKHAIRPELDFAEQWKSSRIWIGRVDICPSLMVNIVIFRKDITNYKLLPLTSAELSKDKFITAVWI